MRARILDLLALAVLAVAPHARGADASVMYALYVDPESGARVAEVDPATSSVLQSWGLPARPDWGDIAARPGDVTRLYAVSRPSAATRISTLDLATGTLTDLFRFAATDFGYASTYLLEPTGLAISASQPSVATVAATAFNGVEPFNYSLLLFDVDLDTGAASNVQTVTSTQLFGLRELADLTYSPNGALFTNAAFGGALPSYWISTIDRSDGSVDPDLRYSCCSAPWSIEFDPLSGQLHLMDFIATSTGSLARVGGLAFIVPEPGTGSLLALGLLGYGLASNGRGGSRHTSRRA